MITFLRKLFIKNYDKVGDEKVRDAHGILAATLGAIINIILVAFKLAIGILASSQAIISDAINNSSDLFSNAVTIFGFKLSNKAPDKRHPYGYQRSQYIAGMVVSFTIVAASLILIYQSINSLIAHDSNREINIYVFIVLSIAILLKLLQGLIYRGLGKAINSEVLKANMFDSLSDSVSTFVVLIASIIEFYNPDLWWVDGSTSLVVALFVFYGGVKMIMNTASPLIGITPNSDYVKKIIKDVLKVKGVLGVHDVMCHSYGPTKVYITLHCEVDGYVDAFKSHDVVDNVEKMISKKYGVFITIHMDPIDTKNKNFPMYKKQIREVLDRIAPGLKFHDLRAVEGPTHTNLIFDIVVPFKFKYKDSDVKRLVTEGLRKKNKKYNTVLEIDKDYLN
jgi:cation diffusion facilitator family transporter